MKKIIVIAPNKENFLNSGIGKYINNYIGGLNEMIYDVEYLYEPEFHVFGQGFFYKLFTLPKKIKREYKGYIKIFVDENFLISIRDTFIRDSIIIIHHYPFIAKAESFMEKIIKWLSYFTFHTVLKKLKNIITVSELTESVLLDLEIRKDRIILIPNSVDLSNYFCLSSSQKIVKRKDISNKYGISDDNIFLLYIGSNESRKNMSILLKTLSILPQNYILIRVGRDLNLEENKRNNQIIVDNNLGNRYYHLQNISEEDLVILYQVSDVYLMPSLYEGFGRPIIEAQACGCPVISTKCGALEEVCGKGALFIENPFNIEEYKNKIIYLMKNGQIRDRYISEGFENIKKYSVKFNEKKFEELIDAVYKSVDKVFFDENNNV